MSFMCSVAFEPTTSYIDDNFYGFNVKLHQSTTLEQRQLLKVKLAELYDRSAGLPALKAAFTSSSNKLNPTFWLDKDGNDTGGAVFHPGNIYKLSKIVYIL